MQVRIERAKTASLLAVLIAVDALVTAILPVNAVWLEAPRFTGEPLLRRALNANLRLGSEAALARVTAFAIDATRSPAMRAEAGAVLVAWPSPSPFDRVDGAYHGRRRPSTDARGGLEKPALSRATVIMEAA